MKQFLCNFEIFPFRFFYAFVKEHFLNKVFYVCRALKILAVKIVIMKWNNRNLWKWNSHCCCCCAVWAVAMQLFFCGSVFVKNSSVKAKSFHSPFSPAPCHLYWAGIEFSRAENWCFSEGAGGIEPTSQKLSKWLLQFEINFHHGLLRAMFTVKPCLT